MKRSWRLERYSDSNRLVFAGNPSVILDGRLYQFNPITLRR